MTAFQVAAIFAVALAAGIVGFLVLTTYNSVVTLGQQVSKAWANIDVALKQRHDELPNLVAAVRDVMAFERDTLTRVTRLRAAYAPDEPVAQQAAVSEATTAAVRQLFAVVERYPDVKAGANVLDLQDEIERLEDILAARRELYNDTVYRYDSRIQQFPTNLLAGLFGWKDRPFFEASADERSRVEVDIASKAG
jgi:LemA protein